jgi:predicted transcriptional regulator
MNKKAIWQIIGLGVIFTVLFFSVSAIVDRNDTVEHLISETTQAGSVTITIEDLYLDKEVSISSNETVLQVLQRLDTEDQQVQLVIKDYSGLGVLIEGMGGKANGEKEEYWQYKVNEIMPQVGADKQKVKNGDYIEWYFGPSEY